MRASPLSAMAVVALLTLAGCTGLTGTDTATSGPSPDEFPDASAVNESAFDRHAAAVANTSFTLTVERSQKDREPSFVEKNFTYRNGSYRYFIEPGASQYRAEADGYFVGNDVTYYSNGTATYSMWREDNGSMTVNPRRYPVFNESSEAYLWGGWFDGGSGDAHDSIAINATYERRGVERVQGVSVMRYEATGVDTLPDWVGDGNASSVFEAFSATLLVDADGVIRHYRYEFVYVDYQTRRISRTYNVTDVGSTDVQKPDWASTVVSNATASS